MDRRCAFVNQPVQFVFMPNKSNPVGPVGARVATTVANRRTGQRMSKTELSHALAAIGRRMSLDVITKIEAGSRPIDVDDLFALALVFDTTPNALLLPVVDDSSPVHLTDNRSVDFAECWEWGRGEKALGESGELTVRAVQFDSENHPDQPVKERRHGRTMIKLIKQAARIKRERDER